MLTTINKHGSLPPPSRLPHYIPSVRSIDWCNARSVGEETSLTCHPNLPRRARKLERGKHFARCVKHLKSLKDLSGETWSDWFSSAFAFNNLSIRFTKDQHDHVIQLGSWIFCEKRNLPYIVIMMPRVSMRIRIFILRNTWDARESKLLLRRRIIKMFHAKLIFLNVESGLCNNAVGHGTRAL